MSLRFMSKYLAVWMHAGLRDDLEESDVQGIFPFFHSRILT